MKRAVLYLRVSSPVARAGVNYKFDPIDLDSVITKDRIALR
jgi:hypothetical protein